jgi:hypothetical protein
VLYWLVSIVKKTHGGRRSMAVGLFPPPPPLYRAAIEYSLVVRGSDRNGGDEDEESTT